MMNFKEKPVSSRRFLLAASALIFSGAALLTPSPAHAVLADFNMQSQTNLQDGWTAPDLEQLPKEEIHFKQGYNWAEHMKLSGAGITGNNSKAIVIDNNHGNGGWVHPKGIVMRNPIDVGDKKTHTLIDESTPIVITLERVAFDDQRKDIDVRITLTSAKAHVYGSTAKNTYRTPTLFMITGTSIVTDGGIYREVQTTAGKKICFNTYLQPSIAQELGVEGAKDQYGIDVTTYANGRFVTEFSYNIDLLYSDGQVSVPNDKKLFCTYVDVDNSNENSIIPKTALSTGNYQTSLFFYGRDRDPDYNLVNQHTYTANAANNALIKKTATSRALLKDRTVLSETASRYEYGTTTTDSSKNYLYILGTNGANNSPTFNAKHYNAAGTKCPITTSTLRFYTFEGLAQSGPLAHKNEYVYHSDFHYCDHSTSDDYKDVVTAGWTMLLKPHTGTIKQMQQTFSSSLILQQLPPSKIAAKVTAGQGQITSTDVAGDKYTASASQNVTKTTVYWKHDQAYTITPAQYYRIKSVSTGNGSTITGTSATNNLTVTNANKAMSYNFSSVTSDKQIVASFERIPAQLTIRKDADSFEYKPGETVTYTIKVGNSVAESAAFNTVITDAVPSDLTVTGVQASGVTGLTATHDDNNVTATCPQLPYGQTAIITITAVAKESGNGKHVTNTATAKCDNPVTSGTVSDTDKVWINSSRLNVTKSVKRYEHQIGERAEFTIGVYDPNAKSGSIAKGVTITDEQLPAKFKIDMDTIKVSGIPDSVQYPVDGKDKETFVTKDIKYTIAPKAEGNGFTIDIPYLPATSVVTITYEAIAQSDINGLDASNSVHVTTSDPNDPGDDSSTRIWVNNARMRIVKSTEQFEHQVGDVAKYTLDVSNMAPGTIAKNVIVKDISLPEGATLIPGSIAVTGVVDPINYTVMTQTESGTVVQGTEQRFNKVTAAYADGTSFNASLVEPVPDFYRGAPAEHGNGFIVNIPYIASSDNVKITYYVRYDAESNGKLVENTATVSCDNKMPDQPKEELTSKEVVYVNTPNMTIDKKTTTPDAKVGDKAHYVLTVKNTNKGTIAGTPVVISDTLPDELTLDADSITVTGVPETIAYPVETGNGATSEEQCENTCDIISSDDGKAFEIDIAYVVGDDSEIVIEYDAVVEESAYGKTLTNIVSVAEPKEPEPAGDDETIYIRSNKQGYQTTLYKSATPESGSLVSSGQEIEYTLTLKNTGSTTVPFTHIRDYIPQGTTFVSASDGGEFVLQDDSDVEGENENKMVAAAASDSLATSRVSIDCGNGYVEWVVADLGPNSEFSVTYLVKVDGDSVIDEDGQESETDSPAVAEQNGESADADENANNEDLPKYIRNVARYQTTSEDPGAPGEIPSENVPELESNEVLHSTDPDYPAPAVIDVEKSSVPAPGSTVYNTDSIKYTLLVKNNGGTDAHNVFIRDILDEKVELIAGSISNDGAYNNEKRCIEWLIASIPAGDTVEISFNVTVVDARPHDIISNQAQFDMDWDVTRDAERELANSTNIVEHVSAGDYGVADKYVEKNEEVAEAINDEENPLSVISALGDAGIAVTILGAASALAVMLVWRRRRMR